MKLGKITVKIQTKGPKWFYCRPIAFANGDRFPSVIGVCHVVYVEKTSLTENYDREEVFTIYGIFSRIENIYETGYINTKVNPITEEIYNQLKEIYPQQPHAFLE